MKLILLQKQIYKIKGSVRLDVVIEQCDIVTTKEIHNLK